LFLSLLNRSLKEAKLGKEIEKLNEILYRQCVLYPWRALNREFVGRCKFPLKLWRTHSTGEWEESTDPIKEEVLDRYFLDAIYEYEVEPILEDIARGKTEASPIVTFSFYRGGEEVAQALIDWLAENGWIAEEVLYLPVWQKLQEGKSADEIYDELEKEFGNEERKEGECSPPSIMRYVRKGDLYVVEGIVKTLKSLKKVKGVEINIAEDYEVFIVCLPSKKRQKELLNALYNY